MRTAHNRRFVVRLALVAFCGVEALGCGGPRRASDEIVVLTDAPVGRIDPRFAFTAWEARVSHLVAPGLVDLRERGLGPTEGLAAAIEERADRVTWEVRLRTDARFSDGTPVTSDDVKYTFDSVRDPLLGSPFRKTWDQYLERVDVIDAHTVQFRLRTPRAPMRSDFDFGIVSRRHAEPLDEALREAARAGRPPPPFDPAHELVGAGPYKLLARSADVVSLARNEHARQRPATAQLTIRTLRDENARVLALVGGSADVLLNVVTPVIIETLGEHPLLAVSHGPSATLTYLGFNLSDPLLANPKVRQAIACAIDRERIVRAKFLGRARLAETPLDAGNPFFSGKVPLWRHDPERARRLLDEAGHGDPDGNGPLPRFRLVWKTSSVRFRVALVQAMARQLADVGIEIEVRPLEFATFISDIRKGNAQLFSLQLTDIVEPDMLRSLLHSSRIPAEENGWSGLNRFRYRSAAVDKWLDDGATERDTGRRRTAYAEAQRLIAEELPLFSLWHEDNMIAYARTLVHPTAAKLPVSKIARLEELLPVRRVELPEGQ